jgi:hypothetical protein
MLKTGFAYSLNPIKSLHYGLTPVELAAEQEAERKENVLQKKGKKKGKRQTEKEEDEKGKEVIGGYMLCEGVLTVLYRGYEGADSDIERYDKNWFDINIGKSALWTLLSSNENYWVFPQ